MAYLFDKIRQSNKLKIKVEMFRKTTFIALIILIAAALLPIFVKPNFVCAANAEIEISSIEDFMSMPDKTTATFKLVSNLDFSEISATYKPKSFCGTLNGNGHTISNLNVVSTSSAGLFLNINNATIYNLTINNFQVYSKVSAGALAVNIKNSTLNNVEVNLGTCYINGLENAGKLATSIKDCNFIDVAVSGGIVNGLETSVIAPSIINTKQETTKTEEEGLLPTEPDNNIDEDTNTDLEDSDNSGNTENLNPDDSESNASGDNNQNINAGDVESDKPSGSTENEPPVSDPGDGNSDGDNTEIGDSTENTENAGDNEGVSTPPVENGDANSSNNSGENKDPSFPVAPDNPPPDTTTDPDINHIVSIDTPANYNIVVNNINTIKVVIICMLFALIIVYGFVETPLKKFIEKHIRKNK